MKRKKKRKVNEATINDLEEIPGETMTLSQSHTDSSSIDDFKHNVNDDNEGLGSGEKQNILSSSLVNEKQNKQFTGTRSAPGSSCVSPIQFDSSSSTQMGYEHLTDSSTSNTINSSGEEFIPPSETQNSDKPSKDTFSKNKLTGDDQTNGEFQTIKTTEQSNFVDHNLMPHENLSSNRVKSNGGARLKTTVEPTNKKQSNDDHNSSEPLEKTEPMSINQQPHKDDDGDGRRYDDIFFFTGS